MIHHYKSTPKICLTSILLKLDSSQAVNRMQAFGLVISRECDPGVMELLFAAKKQGMKHGASCDLVLMI